MSAAETFFLFVYIQFGIGVFAASEYEGKHVWFNLAYTIMLWPIAFGYGLTQFLADHDEED